MIGRELVNLLLLRGAEVTIASLDNVKNMDKRVKVRTADLTLKHNCEIMVRGMDMVFHLAGIKGSPLMCKEKPASFSVPMQQFNLNMMEAAVKMLSGIYTLARWVFTNQRRFLKKTTFGKRSHQRTTNLLVGQNAWESFKHKLTK